MTHLRDVAPDVVREYRRQHIDHLRPRMAYALLTTLPLLAAREEFGRRSAQFNDLRQSHLMRT
jgi:hypothetical protein